MIFELDENMSGKDTSTLLKVNINQKILNYNSIGITKDNGNILYDININNKNNIVIDNGEIISNILIMNNFGITY
jgi:hypothetical protein